MAPCSTHACSVTWADDHGSTTIRICRAYKHLGSIVSVQANMTPEVLARTSAANRTMGAIRAPVLSARNIEQPTKNAALSSFVLSRFFYLTPTWPKLNSTQMRKMEGTYRNPARVASGCPCPDGIPAKSTAQMLSKVSQPPLQIAMAAARLLFLSPLPSLHHHHHTPTHPLLYSFSWMRIDHGVMFSVMTVCPCGYKRRLSTNCYHNPTARASCSCVISLPIPLAVGNT